MDRYSYMQSEAATSTSTFTRGRSVPLSGGTVHRERVATAGSGAAGVAGSTPASFASRDTSDRASARRASGAGAGDAGGMRSAAAEGALRGSRRTNLMKYAADNRVVRAIYDFTTGSTKTLFIALVVLVVAASLYGPVRDCYVAYRTGEVLAKQVALRESYNKSMQSEVDTLLSREGIEDAARSKLGLVMPGETRLTVTGLDDSNSSDSSSDASSDSSSSDSSNSSSASDTITADELEQQENAAINDAPWYIKALDVVFMFTGTSGQTVTSSGASS